jgi:hypothetical protein
MNLPHAAPDHHTPPERRRLVAQWAAEDTYLGVMFNLEHDLLPVIYPTVMGGPPVAWDRWALELPDEQFATLLGPSNAEVRARRDRAVVGHVGPRPATMGTRRLAGSWEART